MRRSRLGETLDTLAARASAAVVARSRLDAPALNAALLRRIAARPGEADALLADPVLEPARIWKPSDRTLGELAGDLLDLRLVDALDREGPQRMPRDRAPYSHQLSAWCAAAEGNSCLVTSGTGSGKTECFMIPMLDDLLKDPASGPLVGVRAIIIYPLNALIESQRERLAAWTAPLGSRLSFALYNGLTPEAPRDMTRTPPAPEIGNRKDIRVAPPPILVTNVTMLEYLLLRAKDQAILGKSRGLLRWIVLDEAHSYIGAQAAEMALLLRRVRAAFGVEAEDVRLMATSATISDGAEGQAKLKRFVADLAGVDEARVSVIQGEAIEPPLPTPTADTPLDPAALAGLSPRELWARLAPHPRMQKLRRAMSDGGVRLREASRLLLGDAKADRLDTAEALLDAAAHALCPQSGTRLIPWRAHLFHRAQGGLWVCVDAACAHRDPELKKAGPQWGFGAVWLKQRDACACAAPVFELVACTECGTVHLRAHEDFLTQRLVPYCEEVDEFGVDAEPDTETGEERASARQTVFLRPVREGAAHRFLRLSDGVLLDNAPSAEDKAVPLRVAYEHDARGCCHAEKARLAPQHFGPAFFMGNELPLLLEAFGEPETKAGLPLGGRRAITFSDSRQGTARLAAKLQQEAERTLTRAFLYHSVQEARGLEGEEREKLERKLAGYRKDPDLYEDEIRTAEDKLAGGAEPIRWRALVARFAVHPELTGFATEVWRQRLRGGRDMADDPARLAEMFLLRELFRRPKVQNNAETMGLLRLAFPVLEERASVKAIPRVLEEAGVDRQGWIGLALATIDFVFRDQLATKILPPEIVPWVSPRSYGTNGIARPGLGEQDLPKNARRWPGSRPAEGRPSRFHRLLYAMTKGDPDNAVDKGRADALLEDLWALISSTAASDIGGGVFQIDFAKAAVARIDTGFLCPVTRRIFGYSPAGLSPYDPERRLEPITLPRLPLANPGGLDPERREQIKRWCAQSPAIEPLRPFGLWTNLHDRVAAYAPFLRAQEHSAQIEREVLRDYEDEFKQGKINLLNCSTTMEMGVDIPNVTFVVNANVPPSASNYRQRVGRAGRRGEAFASAMTYCRDLPLDWLIFSDPTRLLTAPIAAPTVRLDSEGLVQRHVNAALIGAFLRECGGVNVQSSIGAFMGATETVGGEPAEPSLADRLLFELRGAWAVDPRRESTLAALTRDTALEMRGAAQLAATAAERFEEMLQRWRSEHEQLLVRRDGADDAIVKAAFDKRARRMRGEFLLGELARRGFTPAYGFPVDVVSFDHLAGLERREQTRGTVIAFGESRGGASRTLDVAIREYAPGAEVVVDGLVHTSEGVRPAWSANADASGLEDLQHFWKCEDCGEFGLVRLEPHACPACAAKILSLQKILRPAGFIGRRTPHTGYENLGHLPFEAPKLSARRASWQALPDPRVGRLRADVEGEAISVSSGRHQLGYALCLACGRAEAEETPPQGVKTELPGKMAKHKPLTIAKGAKLAGGFCPGGYTEHARVQRYVVLGTSARGDVFELQLPSRATVEQARSLAAGLREALAEDLGAEAREVGVAADYSTGPAHERRVSVFLHDRAAGGAGLATRLGDIAYFRDRLSRAIERLVCPEACAHGCPACVLRPDIRDETLDRPGGLDLAREIAVALDLPEPLRVFGPDTRLLGLSLPLWLEQRRRLERLSSATIFVHGNPKQWELGDWPLESLLPRLRGAGVEPRVVLAAETFADRTFDLAAKLDLHRIAAAQGRLCLADALPFVQGKPVIAIVLDGGKEISIAAPHDADAFPGPGWGTDDQAPLVTGAAPVLAPLRQIDAGKLIAMSAGNAQSIEIGARLDGSIANFGRLFWDALTTGAPLSAVAGIRKHGVASLHYSDRYLVTPLNLALLWQVVAATPSGPPRRVKITTACLNRPEPGGLFVFHSFSDNHQREEVMEQLWPKGVEVLSKRSVPHARRLRLILGDGRKFTILLDQGFGAWRAQGAPRYAFLAKPEERAREIRSASYAVAAETFRTPLILSEEAD